jgi:hypothetical protein
MVLLFEKIKRTTPTSVGTHKPMRMMLVEDMSPLLEYNFMALYLIKHRANLL